MYKNGDKLRVIDGNHYDYRDREGQWGNVVSVDDVSVRLEFETESDGYWNGWFLLTEVTPTNESSVTPDNTMSVDKALDFLTSQGYTVSLSKS